MLIICIKFQPKTKKAWLLWVGHRGFASAIKSLSNGSKTLKDQLVRLDKFTEIWHTVLLEKKPVIFLGDMNVDVQPWLCPDKIITDYQKSRKSLLTLLKDKIIQLDLNLHKTSPTRIQGSNHESILDSVISTNSAQISDTSILPSCSDHAVIVVNIRLKKPPVVKRSKRF